MCRATESFCVCRLSHERAVHEVNLVVGRAKLVAHLAGEPPEQRTVAWLKPLSAPPARLSSSTAGRGASSKLAVAAVACLAYAGPAAQAVAPAELVVSDARQRRALERLRSAERESVYADSGAAARVRHRRVSRALPAAKAAAPMPAAAALAPRATAAPGAQ